MSLTPGARLGAYEILEAIGAGGMDRVRSTAPATQGSEETSPSKSCEETLLPTPNG